MRLMDKLYLSVAAIAFAGFLAGAPMQLFAQQPAAVAIDSNHIPPSGQLRKANKGVANAFKTFRDAARTSGPLDHATIELILIAGFATAGHQEPFKNHVLRARQSGISKEALQQAVIATLGATAVLPAVANALRWIDEVDNQLSVKVPLKP